MSRSISFILIIFGTVISFYTNTKGKEYTIFLILGICMLVIGLYRLSKGIPDKTTKHDEYKND